MKVKCIKNSCSQIPSEICDGLYKNPKYVSFLVAIGYTYIVYSIITIRGFVWYLVHPFDSTILYYCPAALFEVVDGRLSKYWSIGQNTDEHSQNMKSVVLGFPELITNEYLYGEYINDDPKSIEIMEKYIKLMNEEFD